MAGKEIGPRVLPAIVIPLYGHAVNLPLKYLCLYPEILAALNLDERSFLLRLATVSGENNSSKF